MNPRARNRRLGLAVVTALGMCGASSKTFARSCGPGPNAVCAEQPAAKLGEICSSVLQEWSEDEIYIKVNGRQIWYGTFSYAGQCYSLSYLWAGWFPLPRLVRPFTLEVWESDGDHWYDRDDLLGSKQITAAPATCDGSDGYGNFTVCQPYEWDIFATTDPIFNATSAKYEVYVEQIF